MGLDILTGIKLESCCNDIEIALPREKPSLTVKVRLEQFRTVCMEGHMNGQFWLISSRVAMACLLTTICQCSGSGPSGPGDHESLWPADAVGLYARTIEKRICTAFQCYWDTLRVDTVAVCSSPLPAMTSERFRNLNPVAETHETFTDSSYHALVLVTITFPSDPTPRDCDMLFDVSSTDAEHLPSSDGWQVIVRLESVTCGEQYLPDTRRYTYARVGEADCDSTVTVL